MKTKIGKRIEKIRIEMNMSKNKFAELLDVSVQYLGAVESGKNCLSIEKIILLSEKTGISTDYILLGKGNSVNDRLLTLLRDYNEEQIEIIEKIIKGFKSLEKLGREGVS